MPARRYPISSEALAAAARFIREGARAYTRAGEPSHPSLRQVGAHLVGLRLLVKTPPPATLARALARAGVELPPHWRSRTDGRCSLEVNNSPRRGDAKQVVPGAYLCSSVDDGGSASPPARRSTRPSLQHPWRRPLATGAPS